MVFDSRVGPDHWCGRCLDRPGHYHRARATGVHDHSLRLAIHALKFKGRTHLAGPLGRLLFDTYRQHWPSGDIDLVAPVPLHRKRLRRRGFNQAYLLMRPWQLPVATAAVRDLLTRTRDTASQSGLNRRQRRGNIKNAFCMTRPGQAAGKRVLLVDDVLTTGATAEACAGALMRDGALRVDVLTLARA
jgi:ComF family protein